MATSAPASPFASPQIAHDYASSTPSTSFPSSTSRAPLAELSLAPFIFAAQNAHNIASNEESSLASSSKIDSSSSSSPLKRVHGPSPILKPTSLRKNRGHKPSGSISRGRRRQETDAEGDVTITDQMIGTSKSVMGSSVQPSTPPHHSTTSMNLRPHHPHVYTSNNSPLVLGRDSPTLTLKSKGKGSPLKRISRVDHEELEDVECKTPSGPTDSPGPSEAKGGADSLPRKRHRVQPGEVTMAREQAERPLVGSPSPHKPPAGRRLLDSRPTLRKGVDDDEVSQLQFIDSDSQGLQDEDNPFLQRRSGAFVVFQDAPDSAESKSDIAKKAERSPGADQYEGEQEDKENVRLPPLHPTTTTSASPLAPLSTSSSPRSSVRPSALPVQRAHPHVQERKIGKGEASTTLKMGSGGSNSSGGSSSSESGSSFFASSSSF